MSETGWGFGVNGYNVEYTVDFEEGDIGEPLVFILLNLKMRNDGTFRVDFSERWHDWLYGWKGHLISYVDRQME